MCDYSLQHVESRAAKVDDKLITRDFGLGTKGFGAPNSAMAVCLLPGTEIAFDAPVQVVGAFRWNAERTANEVTQSRTIDNLTARFRQINKDKPHQHHDALEFGSGDFVLLTDLAVGQDATVLQLPATPKTVEEAKDQERLEVVG